MEDNKKVILSEGDRLLFENIQKENVIEVRRLLNEKGTYEEVADENGMTLLQHAAYKGNIELCNILLDWGADVNSRRHVHGYTALMFASLAGKVETVSHLLNAGAVITATNSVGKTAAEMAAFVGNHQCAVLINNYIPKSEVEYYSEPRGLEKEPKLPRELVTPLHSLIVRPDVHPISIAMFIQSHPVLVNEADRIIKVLDLMSEKEMKRNDSNELLAFKYHFYSYIISSIKTLLKNKEDKECADATQIDKIIKLWLKESKNNGVQDILDGIVRQGIREFPFRQSPIVQKMVHCLTNSKLGPETSAIAVLLTTLNGHRMFSDHRLCSTCGSQAACKKCSACKQVEYCNQRCQKLHWFTHKNVCSKLAEDFKQMKLREEENNNQDQNETN
ncbi:hypothetical protein CHUAL_006579 [Chamberlinius hualienensis]